MYKVKNNVCPTYISDIFNLNNGGYNLRNSDDFSIHAAYIKSNPHKISTCEYIITLAQLQFGGESCKYEAMWLLTGKSWDPPSSHCDHCRVAKFILKLIAVRQWMQCGIVYYS